MAQHGSDLLRLAFVLTGDAHLAEDVTQSALADAYRHWDRVSAAASPQAYVRRMVVNAHLSWRRRWWTRERPVEVVETDAVALSEPADEVVSRDELRRLLAELPRRSRTVLVLRYYADMNDYTIARTMGITESAVRATASRALAALRATACSEVKGYR